ncbi:MAG: 4'-phosphopantetheinyl transferase superfamily protein [Myxococcota bacterium]|jgi:phosphopantetheinyl transferase (holo-ACP synthase)|nr:4-phosphopantetheinyl transferase family protein [bacterium]MDP6075710.1 4'-phosphopantetheinyl transferase superfamily protein [Myxococcota bacterium]MDP6243811.1 4'-phosphopantetheinyl transferase superfamily protein [Myxococcota bacterium]MDP7075454.1 4'-phosphopantetheinyl transferase superfamily protein [Myxococcota bacterium]MDP7299617.1 4'-phosphopantetheinyl transferase superfamily protein [Myxococcota bacterium]
MLGNDVVDLADPEVRGGPAHPRFDARVFSPPERRALESESAPNRLRWTLWAAKEAAYKLAVKRDPNAIFAASRFVVRLDGASHGQVAHPGGCVAVTLDVRDDTVHAVARDTAASEVVIGLASCADSTDASAAVRHLAVHDVASRLGVTQSDLQLGRRGRIPTLSLRGSDRHLDLSLSHHGRYVAFACEVGTTAA